MAISKRASIKIENVNRKVSIHKVTEMYFDACWNIELVDKSTTLIIQQDSIHRNERGNYWCAPLTGEYLTLADVANEYINYK